MTITDTTPKQTKELGNMDRCDRCPAQAFAVASKSVDGALLELMFCGHHFKKAAYNLGLTGWNVQDNTNKIN